MKIFILLLALGLCLADAVPGGYQQIDAAEAQADPTIQSYIQAGLNAVVKNANNKGFFSNSDFDLTQINSVYEQVVNGINYKFDCNFTDSNGVILRANFVVSHSASTNVTTVPSFSYKVYYPPTTTTTTTVTPSNTTVEAAGETVTDGETTTVTPAEEETEGFVMPVEEATANDNAEAVEEEEAVAESPEEAIVVPEEEDVTVVPEEENVAVTPEEENTEETTTTAPPVVVVSADGFTSISADEYAQSQDLQKYFAFGFQTVVQNGINANKIPNTTFASAKVLSASQKAVKNGERYKFTAQASNGDNVDLNLTFEVAYQVPSYSYTVKVTSTTPSNNTGSGSGSNNTNTNTTVPVIPVIPGPGSQNNTNSTGSNNNTNTNTTTSDGWVNVDVAQVQSNAEIQSNLVNGFNQVIDAAVLKKGLKADNYTITQVVSAARKNLTNGVNYKFNVKGQNADGNTLLDMNFTTYYRYSNQSVKAVAYNYKYNIKNIPVPTQNNTNSGSNQTNTTTGNTNSTGSGNNTNTTTPVDNNNSTVPTNNTTPVSNNTTNTTSNNTNGYVALSADQIQGQDVQNALNYGSTQVVQLGQKSGKIPTDTYNITQVASVLKKKQPAGANYNCTVTLKSAANVTVTTNFNVFSNSTSNAMILKAYSYQVAGIKKN